MTTPAPFPLSRLHRSRLTQVWRSAGWPCKDGIELDLLAAQLLALHVDHHGRESLRLTEAGLAALAAARRQGLRRLSAHDRLAARFARHLLDHGRIVWHELPLRAPVAAHDAAPQVDVRATPPLWVEAESEAADTDAQPPKTRWRHARPDLFSVRNTSVEAYLEPQVHEVKASRADLLADLRCAEKRAAYRALCCACHYVFPAGVAQADEIPDEFGVWLLHGDIEDGRLEQLRPARHRPCTLPFGVWLALAKATPWLPAPEAEAGQAWLGDAGSDVGAA